MKKELQTNKEKQIYVFWKHSRWTYLHFQVHQNKQALKGIAGARKLVG
jgi:hypothetical protein